MMPQARLLILSCLVGASTVLLGCSNADEVRDPLSSISSSSEIRGFDGTEPTTDAGPSSADVSRLIRDALEVKGNISHDQVLQRLGSPKEVETETIPNQYVEDQVDTLRTLFYTGLQALVYDVTGEAKTFLIRLSISSTQYATPEGVQVGASENRVIEEFGPPTRRNESRGELIYQETGTTPTSMVVRIRDDRVVQIGWEFYVA